jgi:hypothetical protein
MSKKLRKRVDEQGRAFAGSQLQVQIYVNRRRNQLNQAVTKVLNLSDRVEIQWRSPLEPRYSEFMDGAFLKALGLPTQISSLAKFWPKSGPRWDGLAILRDSADKEPVGYLLVEGKSYPGEVYGRGCKSSNVANRKLIDAALANTRQKLSPKDASEWSGRLYQFANRLAHVVFLQQITNRDVWLLNLCFTDDFTHPHSIAEWESALHEIRKELGFRNSIPYTVDVFLASRDRRELMTAPI